MNRFVCYLICSIFFSLLAQETFGQACIWAKSGSGNSDDVTTSTATDALGNVYITGHFYSPTITFGSITLTNVGSGTPDVFLVKYDATGNVVWAKSAGGNQDDEANSVAVDNEGNVYITGYFCSHTITFESITLTNISNGVTMIMQDIFLVKYDLAGNVIWAKSVGGISGDFASSVVTDASGNVIISGSFDSPTITFGTTTLTNTVESIFLAKYDGAGNVIWAKRTASTNTAYVMSITTDQNKNIYIAGCFFALNITFGSTTIANPTGNRHIFYTKYDSLGTVIWAKSSDANGYAEVNSIIADNAGNVYITGDFSGPSITFGATTLNNAGSIGSDILLLKYTTTGSLVWAKSVGGNKIDIANSIAVDDTGNIYIAGTFTSNTITFGTTLLSITPSGYYNLFLAKYSGAGNPLWAKKEEGKLEVYASSINTDVYGNIFLSGYFTDSCITIGTSTLTNTGGEDVFLAKYSYTTSYPNILNKTSSLQLFPNPATNEINLAIDNSNEISSVQIYNVLGKEVYRNANIENQNLINQAIKINISNLISGVYFLKAQGIYGIEYKQFEIRN